VGLVLSGVGIEEARSRKLPRLQVRTGGRSMVLGNGFLIISMISIGRWFPSSPRD